MINATETFLHNRATTILTRNLLPLQAVFWGYNVTAVWSPFVAQHSKLTEGETVFEDVYTSCLQSSFRSFSCGACVCFALLDGGGMNCTVRHSSWKSWQGQIRTYGVPCEQPECPELLSSLSGRLLSVYLLFRWNGSLVLVLGRKWS